MSQQKNIFSDAQSSEIQLSMLVKSVRDFAIYMLTADGHVSSWNAGAERFKGYTADEIIGHHFSRFYTEEDRAAGMPMRALETARREGMFETEGWRVRKDGSRFFAHVVIDALHGDDGEVIGFAKITRDITAKRAAAEALELAKEASLRARTEEYQHLLRLFEQAPGFVCFFRGPQHVYELQNEAHHRLAEFKDIIGKPVREALPELVDQGFFELLDQVYTSATPYVGRAVPLSVKPDSDAPPEQRFIDFVYQPIVDEAGQVVGIFSQGNDVTEQVLAQEEVGRKQHELEALILARTRALEETQNALALARELQRDKTHLLRLFDQAPGFICVMNGPSHIFEIANQAYCALIGNRPLIGKPVREALPEMESQGFFGLLDQVYATGQPYVGYSVPINVVQQTGQPPVTRYLDFVYQPVSTPDGKIVGIFVQGNDVTEKKVAEDALKRYQDTLESLVRERTRELAEMQAALQRSQKLEAIGKLTGGVAHDFNNILQVVGGNLQLLSGHVAGNALATRRLETATGAVDRGAKLASQLLAFARRQPLQPVVINPYRILQSMDGLIRRVLSETIHIETVITSGLWNTQVDPHQLENVILNLVINARDAMPSGGRLTIEIGNAMLDEEYVASEPDIAPGQYVMFAISDTGTGMTKDVLEKACDPFFTTKPEGEGTGLGLSMAYGFVKQSGGHFKIYSEVGHGTTIKMYFPRSHDAEMHLPPAVSHSVLAGGTETILVVEDDETVQATVVEMLASLGYRVLKADDADSALGILKSGMPVDLLFTDVVMPGRLRSPELARQAQILHPNIQVLFTSGYTQNAIVHGGRLDPGVQLLSKPYRQEQLAFKVRQMLTRKNEPTTAAEPIAAVEAPAAGKLRILVVEDNNDSRELVCELLSVLGHVTDSVGTGEEAMTKIGMARYDILFTDIQLPGISGAELARIARQAQPSLKVIFASGYGQSVAASADFRHVMLAKPYRLAELEEALKQASPV